MTGMNSTPQGRLLQLFFTTLACGSFDGILFDDLLALDCDARAAWLERWAAQHPVQGDTHESFMTTEDLERADKTLNALRRQPDHDHERGSL